MIDSNGEKLKIGDKVTFTNYKYCHIYGMTKEDLFFGTVTGFTPKKIKILPVYSGTTEITRYAKQVCKVFQKIGIEEKFDNLKRNHPELIEDIIEEINSMLVDWNY